MYSKIFVTLNNITLLPKIKEPDSEGAITTELLSIIIIEENIDYISDLGPFSPKIGEFEIISLILHS